MILRESTTDLQRLIIVFATAGFTLLHSSCKNDGSESRKESVRDLIEYLKIHDVDSTILTQPFFNDAFKKRISSHQGYETALQQMKMHLQNSDAPTIAVYDDDQDVYVLSPGLTIQIEFFFS